MKIISPSHKIETPIDREDIYYKLELYGRNAYKSEDRITEDSAAKFLASIIKRGHESVLEHVSLTVRFICDRGVTHEIVRHRLVSYTQESTRYCNYFGRGIQFIKPCFWQLDDTTVDQYELWKEAMKVAEQAYSTLIEMGATPEQARSVLPNSLKTEIICTANIREWRHILRLRTSKAAHPQMRELMAPLLLELQEKLPVLFGDIEVPM